MKNGEIKRSKWEYFERFLLIAAFICLAISTWYATSTAKKAIEQASNELRPWVIVEKINVFFHDENMKSKFQITNIGKVPAYIKIETELTLNGVPIEPTYLKPVKFPIAIMPNQTIHKEGLTIGGDYYKKVQKKEFEGKIVYSIRIDYGVSKDKINNYYFYEKLEFDQEDMPNNLQNIEKSGIWNIVETDFQ